MSSYDDLLDIFPPLEEFLLSDMFAEVIHDPPQTKEDVAAPHKTGSNSYHDWKKKSFDSFICTLSTKRAGLQTEV
jgi:hypothetical protein